MSKLFTITKIAETVKGKIDGNPDLIIQGVCDLKNSSADHLSYIGDASIGNNVNIGAGTITCNYDGKKKNKTIISDGAFVGSNTALVAPIKIGKKAVVGAGSTLSKNVKDKSLALTRANQIEIKNYKRK